jgi:alpha-1,6-mannosyltransferase
VTPKVTGRALFVLVALTAGMALGFAPRDNVPLFLVGYGVSFGLFVVAYRAARRELTGWGPFRVGTLVLVTAACMRFAAVLAPTSLSDDVYRYVWDGERLAHGENPYAERPTEHYASGEAVDPLFERLNSPKFYTLYPPLAQTVFAGTAALSEIGGWSADRALRLVFALFDLGTVSVLLWLLVRVGRPPLVAALYAWNPFVFWEIAAGGHSEALMLPFLALAAIAALDRRPLRLGLALGVAGLAKLTALFLAPIMGWFLLRRMGGTQGVAGATVAALATIAVLALGYVPFAFDGLLESQQASLRLYYGYFQFNSPILEIARGLLGYEEGVTADPAEAVGRVMTALQLVALVGLTLGVNGRPERFAPALCAASLVQTVLSGVLHPWYLLAAVLLAGPGRLRSPLVLAALLPLSYLAYHPPIGEVTPALLAVQFVPFALVLGVDGFTALLGPILRRRAKRKFRWCHPHLPRHGRLLDLGAGEGYVGAEAAAAGYDVTLVDVVDHNATLLRHVTYDGRDLPFGDDTYDIGVLAYVLHHCRDPERVLREAGRVCRNLVVMESVYESPLDLRALTFLDHLANRFRGIPVEPLYFDTVSGWRQRFAAAGYEIAHEEVLGWFVHKHVGFVLRSPTAGAALEGDTSGGEAEAEGDAEATVDGGGEGGSSGAAGAL